MAFVTVPFLYPYYAVGLAYHDYFRFTKDATFYLFRFFSEVRVWNNGEGYFVTTVRFPGGFRLFRRFGSNLWSDPARFNIIKALARFEKILKRLLGNRYEDIFARDHSTSGYDILATK